ncbi:MAG TPA: DNA-3-methyladenine glycosylase 2 family protein [Clostridiaceae bacterium]|jgi:N-glycosylase/DNA lyase|nr:DNA-3-methyladenine glycosylase 2 family protein [Clostridiaceae bacterium]
MNKWKCEKNNIILKDIKHFDPIHTFECGQCFRWTQIEDNNWLGIVKDLAVNLEWNGKDLIFHDTKKDDFLRVWYSYFDLDRDYGEIKNQLQKDDPVMKEAISFGHGIRLLRQDFQETVISFIISQNNGIPRIQKIVESLAQQFGEPISCGKPDIRTFPTCERLAATSLEELRIVRAGYRDKYIQKAAQQICSGEIDMDILKNGDPSQSRAEMKKLFGVGEKVADCILLFSGIRYDIFPVDRWVRRVMAELYLGYEASNEEVSRFAAEKFGALAGFAQQYLFYYAREKKIGM